MQRRRILGLFVLAGLVSVSIATVAFAEQTRVSASQVNAGAGAPVTITLQDALTRARTNEPQYRAVLTRYGIARQTTTQARAGLLPNVNYNAEFLYTQGNGTATGRFIGANGVHEYVSQANVHQALSLQTAAEYRLARAQEAIAKARSEIAARGLEVTVTQAYYALVVAQRKYATAQRAKQKPRTSWIFHRSWNAAVKWLTPTASKRKSNHSSNSVCCKTRNWKWNAADWSWR